jgi:hypothetical protein
MTMSDEQDCGDCGHDHEHGDEELAIEIGAASQFLLGMRAQNLELLKIASQVAGYGGTHAPLKPNELRNAIKGIWDVYSELYSWVDPEEEEGDEDEESLDDD